MHRALWLIPCFVLMGCHFFTSEPKKKPESSEVSTQVSTPKLVQAEVPEDSESYLLRIQLEPATVASAKIQASMAKQISSAAISRLQKLFETKNVKLIPASQEPQMQPLGIVDLTISYELDAHHLQRKLPLVTKFDIEWQLTEGSQKSLFEKKQSLTASRTYKKRVPPVPSYPEVQIRALMAKAFEQLKESSESQN